MSSHAHTVIHRLGVRARHTFWGGDRESLELRVLCPKKLVDIPLDECLHCAESRGLRLEPDGRALVAICEMDGEGERQEFSENDLPFMEPGTAPTASRASVETIMSTNVICVGAELPLRALREVFAENGISGAPVVDTVGRAVGMVSKTDLVRRLGAGGSSSDSDVVSEIMTPMAFCVEVNASVAKVAALMAFEGLHRVVVVNAARQVVGIVSSLDVARWLAKSEGYVLGGARRNS